MTRSIVENNNFKATITSKLEDIISLDDLPNVEFNFLNKKKEIIPVYFYFELKNKDIKKEIDNFGLHFVYGIFNSLIVESLKTVFEVVFLDDENPLEGFEGFVKVDPNPFNKSLYFNTRTSKSIFPKSKHTLTDLELFTDILTKELHSVSKISEFMNSAYEVTENDYNIHIRPDSLSCHFLNLRKNAFEVNFGISYFNESEAREKIEQVKKNSPVFQNPNVIVRDVELFLTHENKVMFVFLSIESKISNSVLNLNNFTLDLLGNETLDIVREKIASMPFLSTEVKQIVVDLTRQKIES